MIKKSKGIICILLLTLFLTGCWDYRDVDRRSIILSNGIDTADDGVAFTTEIAKLISDGAAQGEKVKIAGSYRNTAAGKYFEGARLAYNSKIPLESFLGAQRAVVFSERYAKAGIKPYINRYYNTQEFRSSALTTVCKEPVEEFFSGKVENDISIGYAVEDTIRYLSKISGTLYKTVQEINSDIYFGNIGYFLPYITKRKDTVEYLGLAAMKDSKLVGIVKSEESSGVLYILSAKPMSTMAIPHPSDEKNLLSIRSTLSKRKIKTTFENNVINIYIDLDCALQMLYPYKIEPISEEDMKKVEEAVRDKIKEDVISAIERSQNEFECDVFGFGRYFKSQNIETYRKINWKEEYLNAKFHVNVKTKIVNTNLIDTNAKVQD